MAKVNGTSVAVKVAGYIRVSTFEQANEGVSLQSQRSKIEAYCSMRGFELVQVIADPGTSGSIPIAERTGGKALLDLIEGGKVNAIIAIKLDRLFRDALDCLQMVKAWDDNAIALHLVDMGGSSIDTTSSIGKLFITLLSGFAEFERNQIAERTSQALQFKKSKGERIGSIAYGFNLKADQITLEPNDHEQSIIRLAADLSKAGLTLRAIASELAAKGLLARNNKPFQPQQISNILKMQAIEVDASGMIQNLSALHRPA